jgi:hypothetical protein
VIRGPCGLAETPAFPHGLPALSKRGRFAPFAGNDETMRCPEVGNSGITAAALYPYISIVYIHYSLL